MTGFIARLTPAFRCDCTGSVHSVFEHTANLSFTIGNRQRLLTLVLPGAPKIPDSICIPLLLLQKLRTGEPVALREGTLHLSERSYPFLHDTQWTGKVHRRSVIPQVAAFLRESINIPCGLDRLPVSRRREADAALQSGHLQACLGLGSGLTPSFDDACVGMMAVCASTGCEIPRITDTSATTDISARYLKLASEGYFSQAILDVLDALYNEELLPAALRALLKTGASSGADTLYGMRMQLIHRFV